MKALKNVTYLTYNSPCIEFIYKYEAYWNRVINKITRHYEIIKDKVINLSYVYSSKFGF